MRWQAGMLWWLIRGYQLLLSPLWPGACRFEPSCSHYAQEALLRHGTWRGAGLAAWRVLRCHPWGGSGLDPVPPAKPAGLRIDAR
jgi:putative membrane protein insertion efficiency factor